MLTRRFLQAASLLALAGTIVPPALFLAGRLSLSATQNAMLTGTIAWFAVTPLWMGRSRYEPDHDSQPVAP